ncbi:hypothetical protein M0804_002576 [Polistes exclamans]|nr:hypothetical protein M0804_002576 [Polistes exclamans]
MFSRAMVYKHKKDVPFGQQGVLSLASNLEEVSSISIRLLNHETRDDEEEGGEEEEEEEEEGRRRVK